MKILKKLLKNTWFVFIYWLTSYIFLVRLLIRPERIFFGQDAKKVKENALKNFLVDGGKFTDKISHRLAMAYSKNSSVSSFQSSIIDEENALLNLQMYGYHVVPNYLTKQQCASVLDYALNMPSYPRSIDKEAASQAVVTPGKFQQPYLSARYDFSPDSNLLFGCDVLQDLISDKNLHQIAERYLGLPGLLDPVELWWFVPYSIRDTAWAENYHFDYDSLKWLKFFFNFEEISIENGPHCYIEKTHQSGGIHRSLRKKGYARLDDHEVRSVYGEKAEKVFTIPAGSLLIEDTRGLHKGLTPQIGRRLLFSYQLSNILFLTDEILNKRIKPKFPMNEKFKELYLNNPEFFARYFH